MKGQGETVESLEAFKHRLKRIGERATSHRFVTKEIVVRVGHLQLLRP